MVNVKDYRNHDPFETVMDLRRTSDVLIFGNMMYPHLREHVNSMEFARRGSDLTRLVNDDMSFDRMIVSRDVDVSNVGLMKLVSMNRGLIYFFIQDEQHEVWLNDYMLHRHPWADVWTFQSNCGPIFATTATGAPYETTN